MTNQLIDIGVNLMHRSFDHDREDMVARALAAGVSPLLLTGTSLRSSDEASRYAAKFPGKLFAKAGIHPHDTRNCKEHTLDKLRQLAKLSPVDWTITGIFHLAMYSGNGLRNRFSWPVSCKCRLSYMSEKLIMISFVS